MMLPFGSSASIHDILADGKRKPRVFPMGRSFVFIRRFISDKRTGTETVSSGVDRLRVDIGMIIGIIGQSYKGMQRFPPAPLFFGAFFRIFF